MDDNNAAVIGAVIQLGYCCDFLDTRYTVMLKAYYELMAIAYKEADKFMPENIDLATDPHQGKLLRFLDCRVIEYMHQRIEDQHKNDKTERGYSDLKIFESARGVFIEGGEIYKGAGIFEKSHIQICIRNSNCIKGFFLPRKEVEF